MGFLRSNSDSAEARPGARERARMRRRLRRQRQMREALLLDLGALVFELHRHGRREPELLQAKAAELSAVDKEVRALAEALGSDQTIMQLVATGVAGSCENCGALLSVDARYCASCGAPAVPALSGEGERAAFSREQPAVGHAALATGAGEQLQAEVDEAFELAEEEAFGEEVPAEDDTAEREVAEETAEREVPEDTAEREVPEETAEWEVAEETAVREVPEDYAVQEAVEDAAAEEPAEDEQFAEEEAVAEEEAFGEETSLHEDEELPDDDQEPMDEGLISVSRMPPKEDAPAMEDEEPEDDHPEDDEPEDDQPEDDEPEDERLEAERGEPASEQDGVAPTGGHERPGQPPRAMADDALDTAAKAIRSGLTRSRDWIRGRRSGD